ncbi:hypothetical protein GFC29_3109 [Anoxybacillus sp. B7M1]|nr:MULTISPECIES: DUF3954 domain-containing protein [unclassified Anoxybacillus]ANB57450.1 hypothetical protein GFC28_2327 [Anoxybacillus sp. B2M1]ANB65267.1 hypothetical protein GFC29_3109 [Anoxybacillus sp. B7M1]
MNVNNDKVTVEISLMENSLYVVKDGRITKIEVLQTGYGEYTVI